MFQSLLAKWDDPFGSSIAGDVIGPECLIRTSMIMRIPRFNITNMGWVVVLCLAAFFALKAIQLFWSFRQLERNAQKRITGNELQAWATNLLQASATSGYVSVSNLGTNFPQQLLGVYHQPPSIFVHCGESNSPGWVSIMWGGGVIGLSGFCIGPTNYVGNGHRWQDGVYFLDGKAE